MGKNLTQQKRGKGSPTYKAMTHRAAGDTKLLHRKTAVVKDLIRCPYHTAPLAVLVYADGTTSMTVAVEGSKVGNTIHIGKNAPLEHGNALPLSDIPDGAPICNVESVPGDGGKYCRGSGATAKVVGRSTTSVTVQFKSKKKKTLNPNCYAILGTVAGGGRTEKPFLKAGNKFKAMKAKNKYWPKVSGAAMNAVDHPLGGKRSGRKGRPTIAPRNAPPGRKVGMLRPRSTGRSKGRKVGTLKPKGSRGTKKKDKKMSKAQKKMAKKEAKKKS